MQSKQNIVTIGSSSEISQCFYKQATSKDFLVHTISRIDLKTSNHLRISDYINEVEKIKLFLSNIENPIIIFFNGFLAENRDLAEPTIDEINKTDYVNYQIPYFLSKSLSENKDIKKFIFISSIASVRPRYKNYIYGLSKYKLEKSLRFLNLSKYLVLRFGKIKTKRLEIKILKLAYLKPSKSNFFKIIFAALFAEIVKGGLSWLLDIKIRDTLTLN